MATATQTAIFSGIITTLRRAATSASTAITALHAVSRLPLRLIVAEAAQADIVAVRRVADAARLVADAAREAEDKLCLTNNVKAK